MYYNKQDWLIRVLDILKIVFFIIVIFIGVRNVKHKLPFVKKLSRVCGHIAL